MLVGRIEKRGKRFGQGRVKECSGWGLDLRESGERVGVCVCTCAQDVKIARRSNGREGG